MLEVFSTKELFPLPLVGASIEKEIDNAQRKAVREPLGRRGKFHLCFQRTTFEIYLEGKEEVWG